MAQNNDIAELRAEVTRLTKIVSAQGAQAYSDVKGRAADALQDAKPHARAVVAHAKAEGSAIAEAAREHPAAAGSVVVLAGLIGVAIGYVIGAASQPEPPRRRYW